ncbi:GNAT family N-acetyltransferase [Fulvivirgaceae bacterium BMA10]|uniref:GNAT family N-acetyltransferase n=1 Tax=Splendidivirga corallicola TaxID=3051826 RepID=A0ABT8KJG3_9BACT|nr:GNAT family N-acetyltransferase [Fulvivirgaceae bacterium BMA10]
MEIRKAGIEDLDILQKLTQQTFLETYADQNTEEDMQEYLEAHFTHERLRESLHDPKSMYYIMFDKDEAVGYLKLRKKRSEKLEKKQVIELERIYVLKNQIGKGLGKLLIDEAIGISKRGGYEVLWLGVWEKNFRAIAFYEKCGFKQYGEHIFRLGSDVQRDYLMKLDLID